MALDADRVTQLDVRPILEGGHDPFGVIIEFAQGVGPGGELVLVAPFDPVPLRGVLAQDGFDSRAEQLAPRLWRVCFRRTTAAAGDQQPAPRRWQEADALHIDTTNVAGGAARDAVAALRSAAPPGFDVVAHQGAERRRFTKRD